ncbi:hypothetical protein Tco_0581160 [Tanacetum coccineum]
MLTIELQAIEQKMSLLETKTTVTDVSESESLKTKAIPKQTASSKEPTNSLKAEVLLKSLTKDNTDPSSLSKTSKLVHSSPSTAGSSKMTILSPNNLVQELIPDYLNAVKQDPKYYYVIYKGPHYQEGLSKKPVLLRPKIQKIKEEHRDQRFKIPEDKDQSTFEPPMKFEEFRQIWSKARATCPGDFLHEKFITTDKVTKSL